MQSLVSGEFLEVLAAVLIVHVQFHFLSLCLLAISRDLPYTCDPTEAYVIK